MKYFQFKLKSRFGIFAHFLLEFVQFRVIVDKEMCLFLLCGLQYLYVAFYHNMSSTIWTNHNIWMYKIRGKNTQYPGSVVPLAMFFMEACTVSYYCRDVSIFVVWEICTVSYYWRDVSISLLKRCVYLNISFLLP